MVMKYILADSKHNMLLVKAQIQQNVIKGIVNTETSTELQLPFHPAEGPHVWDLCQVQCEKGKEKSVLEETREEWGTLPERKTQHSDQFVIWF